MKIEEEMGVNIILPSSRNEDHISKILELTIMYKLMSMLVILYCWLAILF